MLYGEFRQILDGKGRVFIPAKMRDALGEAFMVSRGLDRCVCIYPMDEWASFVEKLEALPIAKERMVRRFFYSGAVDGSLDTQGRVTLSPLYREFASLEKDIVVVGNKTHIEIWSASAWDNQQLLMSSEEITRELEKLDF